MEQLNIDYITRLPVHRNSIADTKRLLKDDDEPSGDVGEDFPKRDGDTRRNKPHIRGQIQLGLRPKDDDQDDEYKCKRIIKPFLKVIVGACILHRLKKHTTGELNDEDIDKDQNDREDDFGERGIISNKISQLCEGHLSALYSFGLLMVMSVT